MQRAVEARQRVALEIMSRAAEEARRQFGERDSLDIESKGAQDWVSQADRQVESLIRAALAEHFPDDGVLGEEHGQELGQSGFDWVIDPIDGTTCFINGMPGWCLLLALVHEGQLAAAVTVDPLLDETFAAVAGGGATLNGQPIRTSQARSLDQVTVSVGHSARVDNEATLHLLQGVMRGGGVYHRSGSGGLALAYVAAGRLGGYVEVHMNAWDCLAGLLLIEEAGGRRESFDLSTMLTAGGRVIAGGAGIYEALLDLADVSRASSESSKAADHSVTRGSPDSSIASAVHQEIR